jgi:hypothetical protein
LVEVEIQDGQGLMNAAPYINYALFGTPLEAMYGEHLERLHEIKKKMMVAEIVCWHHHDHLWYSG